jgi:hypothetical protein
VKIVAEQFEADRSDTLEKIWIYLLPGKEQFASPRLPGLIQVDLLDNRNSQAIDPQLIDVLLAADADR